jgi:hypothetical protein
MNHRDEKVLKDSFIVFEYYKNKIHNLYLDQSKIGNFHTNDSGENSLTRDQIFKRMIYYFQKVYKLHYDINRYILNNDYDTPSYYLRNLNSYMDFFLRLHSQIISEFGMIMDEEEVNIDYEYILRINSNSSVDDEDEVLEIDEIDGNSNETIVELDATSAEEEREKFLQIWETFKKKMQETGVKH